MDLSKLKDPFKEEDIEWRIGRCGKSGTKIWATCLAYIQARAAQDRLDEVAGPENWTISYSWEIHPPMTDGIMANISIKVTDNGWITKTDGSEQTDMESFKGGLSSAFKRAASVWGIGRYLYGLTEGFATIVEKDTANARYGRLSKDAGGDVFYWIPPQLPDWALPEKKAEEGVAQGASGTPNSASLGSSPKTPAKESKVTIDPPLKEAFVTEDDPFWKPKTESVKKNSLPMKGSSQTSHMQNTAMSSKTPAGDYIVKITNEKHLKGKMIKEIPQEKLKWWINTIESNAKKSNWDNEFLDNANAHIKEWNKNPLNPKVDYEEPLPF